MKRITILLAMLLLLTACGKTSVSPSGEAPSSSTAPVITSSIAPSDAAVVSGDGYENHFFYTHQEDVYRFAVDSNGIAYVNSAFPTVTAYDMVGNKVADYNIQSNGSITHLCVSDGVLYVTAEGSNPNNPKWDVDGFICYNIATGEQTLLTVPTDVFTLPKAIKKIACLDGKLYILGILEEYITDDYEDLAAIQQAETNGMIPSRNYDGRILATYDLTSETFEIVFDGPIRDFALTPYGTIMLQVYDPEHEYSGDGKSYVMPNTRYYFAELYPDTMSLGDRIYREIMQPAGFATDGQGVMFSAWAGVMGVMTPGYVYYWSLGEDTGVSQLTALDNLNPWGTDSIAYCNGFTYMVNTQDKTLERVRNSAYIDFAPPIQIIGANLYGEFPKGGYNVNFSMLDSEEFALSVLSGGVAYDIAYVGTRQDSAYNIREKGSFYPLNDVPGVQAYLDACFPYIKEAATNENGEIWMLPIDVSVDGVTYQVENCKKAGLDFAGAATAVDIIGAVEKGIAYDPTGKNFVFNPTSLLQKSLLKYLRTNQTLDTPEFRTLAEAIKGFVSGSTLWGTAMPHVDNPDFLFDNLSLQTSSHLIGRDDLSIAPITGTDGASPADCVFLCVNPDSDKLEKTLEYISAVCESLMTKETSRMIPGSPLFTGSAYVTQLQSLYANSVIDFNISDEVFADVFDRYLAGEIPLDTLITEADRKLRMYLNE